MLVDRIREDMPVVTADDRCVGFVGRLEDTCKLRVTSISAGYGHDHVIPLSWVSGVDKFVYLNKTSTYLATNWLPPSA
jgi:hypothetical protein